MYYGF